MTVRQVYSIIEGMAQLLDDIRAVVEGSGKTRYHIAKDLSISQAHLSRLMSGERGLSIEMWERLTQYLGLEIVIRPKRRRTKKG